MTEVECPYCGSTFYHEHWSIDDLDDIETECPDCQKLIMYDISFSGIATNIIAVEEEER